MSNSFFGTFVVFVLTGKAQKPHNYRGVTVTLKTHHTRWDSSGLVIGRYLYLTKHTIFIRHRNSRNHHESRKVK
jgi:hypothetical protein